MPKMRREFLIDGYNFLWAWSRGKMRPGPGNSERARAALVAFVAARIVPPDSATVVFDATLDAFAKSQPDTFDSKGVHVRFSVGYPNADELIRELCRKHSFPKQLVVVSNDLEVQKHARRRKAQTMSCADFERLLLSARALRGSNIGAAEKPVEPDPADSQFWSELFSRDESAGKKLRQ